MISREPYVHPRSIHVVHSTGSRHLANSSLSYSCRNLWNYPRKFPCVITSTVVYDWRLNTDLLIQTFLPLRIRGTLRAHLVSHNQLCRSVLHNVNYGDVRPPCDAEPPLTLMF